MNNPNASHNEILRQAQDDQLVIPNWIRYLKRILLIVSVIIELKCFLNSKIEPTVSILPNPDVHS